MKRSFSLLQPMSRALFGATFFLFLHQAHAQQPKASQTMLAFNVTARFAALQNGKNVGQPPQLLNAGVVLAAQQARITTELRERPVVYLVKPPHLYKLLPDQQAGLRWKLSQFNVGATLPKGLDWQTMLRDPKQLPAQLKKRGAKRIGSATVNGQATDIYSGTLPPSFAGGSKTTLKAWLRRLDSLPVRVETRSPSLYGVVTWNNYRRVPFSHNWFRVPANYSIRDSTSRPRLFP